MGPLTDRKTKAHMGSNRWPPEQKRKSVSSRANGWSRETAGPCLPPSSWQQQSKQAVPESAWQGACDANVSNGVCPPGTNLHLTEGKSRQRTYGQESLEAPGRSQKRLCLAHFHVIPLSGTPQGKKKKNTRTTHHNGNSEPPFVLNLSEAAEGWSLKHCIKKASLLDVCFFPL